MEPTRCAARELAREGAIDVVQRGKVLDPDQPFQGPIRLRLKGANPKTGSE